MHPLVKALVTNVCAAGGSRGWRSAVRSESTWQAHVLNPPIFYPRLCPFTFAASRSTEFVADPVDLIVVFMPEISRPSTHMGGTMRPDLRPAAGRFPEG